MSSYTKMENKNLYKGVPIEIVVKIKPESSQRQDLRINENKISLLDVYDRPVEEFITNGSIFEQIDSFRNSFDNLFKKYLSALIQGVNFTIFTFGAKSTGKTFSLEGNTNESGIYSLLIENLFAILESKRDAILEEIQSSESPELESTSFSYNIKMKFVELKDESVTDLLQKYNQYKQPGQIIYAENEGYYVGGAAWVELSNYMAFPDLFFDAIKYRSNQDYNKVNKSSTIMTFEITQILENKITKDVKNIVSRVNIFDLPSADLLSENFRNLSNSFEYKSLYSFQMMIAELAKNNNNVIPTIYENSHLTKLLKEHIGGGGLCMGIFCLQNDNFPISSIVFKIMKICSHIQNFPIVMDSNSMGLLRKFRTDINYYSKFKDLKPVEVRPPTIITETKSTPVIASNNNNPNNNNILPEIDLDYVEDLQKKLHKTEIELERMRKDMFYMQDENKRLLYALARKTPTKTENTMQDYMYNPPIPLCDPLDKLEHLEEDVNEINEIMITVNNLSDRIKELQEERRLIEEENLNLRSSNQTLVKEIEKITYEYNNYKANVENEIYQLKEHLDSTNNELDYMRNEAEKYRKIQSDLQLEIDEREVQYKKQLEDMERETESKLMEIAQEEKKNLDLELRESRRKIELLAEENIDYSKVVDEMKIEMNKINLRLNEIRNTLRDVLGRNVDDKNDKKFNVSGMQINPNSKIKLLKSYTDRENEFLEEIGLEKAKSENLKEKFKKIRTYARKVRNLALDYHPIKEELPKLLTKDIDILLDEVENESILQFLEYEVKSLRERNKRYEIELKNLKDGNKDLRPEGEKKVRKVESYKEKPNQDTYNQAKNKENSQNLNNTEIQKILLDEIEKLKNNRPFTTSKELEQLQKEKERLTEENKKLKSIINENFMSRDNVRNDNIQNLVHKNNFLEKSLQQLERERSELSVRAIMAEEQLKNFQELMNSSSQQYQKKILELSKRLDAAEMRSNHKNKLDKIK